MSSFTSPTLLALGSLVSVLSPVMAAAQDAPIRPAYPGTAQSAPYTQGQAYDYRNPPPEPEAPQGYDGTQPPPPPTGYTPPADAYQQVMVDQRYAGEAERWARENCVKAKGNTAGGALVGGILGAIIGSAVGGRHDHGTGTVVGAAVGAVGGAAVANSSGGDTSPGCPPGYVVRREAVAYVAPVPYAAPTWYRPWVYTGGYWAYRAYPYSTWYYDTYRGPRAYGHPQWRPMPPRPVYGGGFGGSGWRGDWHGGGHRHH